MLFNLTCKDHFPSKKTGRDLWNKNNIAIDFNNNSSELGVIYEPFNGIENCMSYANEPGFGIPYTYGTINKLTMKEDGAFTITQMEVWQVKFL